MPESRTHDGDPVPEAARGVWRREELYTPSGYRDATTRVFWLQTQRFYADIRVPADRSWAAGAVGFEACSETELLALAKVQGFGGALAASPTECAWRRDYDYQPPGDIPDQARYDIDGEILTEVGIHADYTEIWRREVDSETPLIAFALEGASGGLFLVAGDHFMTIEGTANRLPAGADLAEIVARDLAEGRRDLAIERLSMPIHYGRVVGAGRPWKVLLSTWPWLEGGSLFPTRPPQFDATSGALVSADATWRLVDSSLALNDISTLFAVGLVS
jgi:hypothetical protein